MRYLIVAALEQETAGLESFAPLIHTGIGKLNAAIKLYQAIIKYQPDCIINYGTAGSVSGHSGLLKVDTFIQRDMDARGLGVARGITPFENESLPEAKGIVLASGDSFVTHSAQQLEGLNIKVDLIDMEGFALHKVCQHHQVDFECYKYVTDNTDEEASNDWLSNVAKGAVLFAEVLKQDYGRSLLQ
ncbi:MAG: hypothetical protein KAH22_04225 [Thiotrichaceae bacterium]|nr:hypothetical protein [Thiotrichaceae bacterium]